MTYAKVIADSISPSGHRLTTFEVRFHRFVLAEFNTHRVLSKNSASSRAIPVQKQIERIVEDLAYPVSWPAEQKGMQGGEELPEETTTVAKRLWHFAAKAAVDTVQGLRHLNGDAALHKSVTNRLLEPFMWHTVVVTATAWENFFAQRCSPLAQPEIKAVADLMHEAYANSTPTYIRDKDWHLPYVDRREVDSAETAVKVSAARCARVSYLTHDGKRDIAADLALYDRLVGANPPHWSPLEHVATPDSLNMQYRDPYTFFNERLQRWEEYPVDHLPVVGNLLGWRSLRLEVEAEQGIKTYV